MANKKEVFQQAQQGTGSAEQTGQDRDAQQNEKTSLHQQERKDIASQIGESKNDVASVRELGGLSGRDDAAGGDNNGMRSESTGEATDR